ncbi:hypothetical protein Vafri_17428 [Volvox africanus]|uniref:Protein kinase domain-containing protein n=1 Tax=Volvox africanus TaxID=51714 RepID=A0A8J4F7N6_9CHLO|nr:hypothetical protein Vafri_17428 [Volvox africanus]
MVFACCFGGGGGDNDPHGESNRYGFPAEQVIGKTSKTQELSDLPNEETIAAGAILQSGNTAPLSAGTSTDSSIAYQLNNLTSALAGLSGSWYERVSSAASRLSSLSGAELCSVSILGGGHDQFTVVYVTWKDPECTAVYHIGSQLPALQAGSEAHHAGISGSSEMTYNSVQVLQLLQTPLLYSFSDPIHGSREMKQPPYDWKTLNTERGLLDFCAIPLMHETSVVGAVTLAFGPPPPSGQQMPQLSSGQPATSTGMAAYLMRCDEQSLRNLSLLLSLLLAGQDLNLAQQLGDMLASVNGACNLQQVVTAITGGAERILQLKTRVVVAVNLALLPSLAPGGGTGGMGGSGRAIIFEERGAHIPASGAGSKDGGSRSTPGGGGTGALQQQPGVSPLGQAASTGTGTRILSTGSPSSYEGASGTYGSRGALLWQANSVQARALGLRHTLLANLPSNGTVVHDCSSYMQQVGCPKRDLYLLSSSKGAPPFSLAIAPALLQLRSAAGHANATGGASDGSVQIILYVAVAMQLPMELLNEILAQAHQLAVRVLAPLLKHKLAQSGLAEEWMLLLGKCSSGRTGNGGATAAGTQAPLEPNGESSTGNSGQGGVTVEAGGAASNATGGGRQRPSIGYDTQDSRSPGGSRCSDSAVGNEPSGANRTGAGREVNCGSTTLSQSTAMTAQPPTPAPACASESLAGAEGAGSPLRADAPTASNRTLSTMDIRQGSQVMGLSTALAGAFVGDTRTHMDMLVSSFKDTINGLQARRAEESEELSVLKLGKVLGRGGSGLVFQGYLHLGLEVAVKLFENPDDTDPDAGSSTEHGVQITVVNLEGSSVGTECGAMPTDNLKEQPPAGSGSGSVAGRTTATAALKTAAAQTTKRQRDLLRNALELGVTSSLSHPNIVQGYCHWVNVVLMQDASLNRCWLMGQAEYMSLAPPGSPPPPLCSALVMEYCDMGSLIHALKRGTFSMPDGKPNMEVCGGHGTRPKCLAWKTALMGCSG